MAGATAEIVIAPIMNVTIANATTLPPRFQAPAPVAPSAAMVDDDDAVTTVVAIPQITHATAQARAHPIMPHATTPLPRFQAPAPSADSTAMADDDDAAIANNSDGAQARGAEDAEVSAAQGAQGFRQNASVVSECITGVGAQLGAAEDVGASPFGAESEAAPSNGIPRPSNWQERTHRARKNWSRRYVWNGKYEGSE